MPIPLPDVREAYRIVLGREAESESVVLRHAMAHSSVLALVKTFVASKEFETKRLAVRGGPYRTSFDVGAVFAAYGPANRRSRPGFITDWVGSLTDSRFIRDERTEQAIVEGAPSPRNFHADEAEWAASLRSVQLAAGQFNAIELGAGWAPWLVSCTLAARRKGITDTYAIAVEADAEHAGYAEAHFRNNGFADGTYRVIAAAAGPSAGFAIFPISPDSSSDWGMRPQFHVSEGEADGALANNGFVDYRGLHFSRVKKVPVVTLQDLLGERPRFDLVHIDVQGSEADIVETALDRLSASVRYFVIGTHSRAIEVRLLETLSRAGWLLEVEKPCEFSLLPPDYPLAVDGTQAWRNSRL